MSVFRKFLEGIRLIPKTTSTVSTAGDIDFDTTANKLNLHNGTTSSPVVTEAHSATLTNKTISGGSNTITNVPAASMSGQVPIANGGTGSSTQQTALNTIAGAVTSGQVLRGDGTNITVSAIQASDIPTLNQNTTGTASNITASSNSSLTTLSALSLPGSQVSGNISGNAANVTGTVALSNGGTGQTTKQPAFDALSPMSTKGDIPTFSTVGTKQAVGTDGLALMADSSQSTGLRYAQLANTKNYIINSDAEGGTSGWSTYLNTAQSTPVNGTGAGASVTWTQSASSPLRGSNSFLFTKDAVNRQGQGVAAPFTLDAADKAKMIQISFDYLPAGSYADGDLTVYIFDGTNAQIIQPDTFTILNSGVVQHHVTTFQTSSNATAYRLILHVASVNASAWTMQIDNVVVGPAIIASTVGTNACKAYRSTSATLAPNASTVQLSMDAIQASTGNSGYSTANGNFVVPEAGWYYFNSIVNFYNGSWLADSEYSLSLQVGASFNTATFATHVIMAATSSSAVTYYGFNVSGVRYCTAGDKIWVGFYSSANHSGSTLTTQSGDAVSFSAVLLKGADSRPNTNVTSMIAYKSTSNHTNPSGWQQLQSFNSAFFDTTASFNATTGELTIRTPGYYNFSATVGFTGSASGSGMCGIYLNGTLYLVGSSSINNVSIGAISSVSGPIKCVAGDIITLWGWQNSASSLAYQTGTATFFSMAKIAGSTTPEAGVSVSALYTGAPPTGTLNAGYNIVTFGTKVKDSHNAYSGGTYVIPVSGTYSIVAQTTQNGAYALNSAAQTLIYIDGVEKYSTYQYSAAGILSLPTTVSVLSVPLLAGQLVQIRSYNNGTSPTFSSSASQNYFSITKTGNY